MRAPRGVAAALAALIVALLPAVAAGGPGAGLLWNRSGLPAVFPLQIRTDPGRDYYVVLREVESGEDWLAAYVEGGRFFRVLVPPGTFRLHFAAGTGWQDEARLFGPATETFALARTLSFGVRGLSRKAGHLVDLRDVTAREAAARIRTLALCQFVDWTERPRPEPLAATCGTGRMPCPDPPAQRGWRPELREALCGPGPDAARASPVDRPARRR